MSDETIHPEPADHGKTVRVGEYDLAPGAKLSQASVGPVGASEFSSYIVLDVDPDAGELELFRMTDSARRTVTAAGLEADLGLSTFVLDDGLEDESDEEDADESDAANDANQPDANSDAGQPDANSDAGQPDAGSDADEPNRDDEN